MPTPTPNDLTRHQLDELDRLLQRMLKLPLATPSEEPLPKPPPLPQPDLPPGWRSDGPAMPRVPFAAESAAKPSPTAVMMSHAEEPAAQSLNRPEIPSWGPDPLARYQSTDLEAPPPAEFPRLFGPPSSDSPIPAIPPTTAQNSAVPTMKTGTLRGVDSPATPVGFKSQLDELAPIQPPEPVSIPLSPVSTPTNSKPVSSPRTPIMLWPLVGLNMMLEGLLKLFGPIGTWLTSPSGKNLLAVVGFVLLLGAALWSGQGLGYWKLPIPR